MQPFEGVIGIDLGTTYSCVAVFHHNAVDVIPNDQGNRTTPSRIAFHNNQLLIGDAALNLSSRGAPGVVYDAKRLIGRRMSDKEVKDDKRHWPFEVVATETGDRVAIRVEHKGESIVLEPQQVSAHVLTYLKQCAERHLGKSVRRAVITVPAYFNDAQRQATRDAGAIAGLEVIRIINEPTAAALCYGLGVGTALGAQGTTAASNVLVFDFGGGTFDVSVITIDSGAFEVRSTAGDTHLGGQDMDQNVLQWFYDDIKKRYPQAVNELSENLKVRAKLRNVAEKVKRALSHSTQEEVSCDGILPGGDDYVVTLSRAKFDEINAKVYARCLSMVERALKDAKMDVKDIHEVVMVGGSSRVPKIRDMVSQYFNGKALCTAVNPDEAIAVGAAIQAGILSTDASQQSDRTAGVVLMDVVSLSIGLDVDNGHFDILIPRNTTIPFSAKKEFSTTYNNQTEVDIEVFEGERPLTKHNHLLGSFTLDGISKGKKGAPSIVVSLSVDANGILTVDATETKSAKTKQLVVACKERLSTQDVNRMIEEAAKMRGQDKSEAAYLLKTQEVVTALAALQDKQRALSSNPGITAKKIAKLNKRCEFMEAVNKWFATKAQGETDDVLDAKIEKIWRLVRKAESTCKKLSDSKRGKKRRRSEDEDDEEEGGGDEGSGEDDEAEGSDDDTDGDDEDDD